MAPQFTSLPDGRLHFSHGPIDLIIQVDGQRDAVRAAHQDAWQRFQAVLPELVSELALLQRPVGETCPLGGVVARRMWAACHPFRASFITPMAAVAGAVAQEIIACYDRPGIDRAAVNNGGDIALHLGADASYRVGVCTDIVAATQDALRGALQADGTITITSSMPVRGVATSGWGGRSFSLGIADSVTVLAASAAQADAAATVIANAVNVDDARIRRVPANQLKDNADLGDIPVTVDVPRLEPPLIDAALHAGLAQARRLQEQGLIFDAVLACQGRGARLRTGLHKGMTVPALRSPGHSAAQSRFADCATAALC
ncbi:UPF0280 family protein [Noviherbaspirillum sp.]|uniref:UPF0280 family protein n=1 Tax=Noviherbaspirillum sp. TaxID=1926288 RepID=UPI002FE19CA7